MVAVGILVPAAAASAHARFLRSEPKIEAQLKKAPESVTIDFSEPPVSAKKVVVEDGCGTDVITSADVDDKQVVAELGEGQPGRWTVRFRVVSAVDGHPTKDEFAFTVAGERDCRQGDAGAPPPDEGDDSSSFPIIIALAAATVLVVAAALLVRKRT